MKEAIVEAVHDTGLVPAFRLKKEVVNCHHNYVAKEHHYGSEVFVTRKGAVRAGRGDLGIIPGSMGARSYIVRGKGNRESFESCSHGAGRVMSRNEAKKRFTLDDHAAATAGVECRKDVRVLDETPGAYKASCPKTQTNSRLAWTATSRCRWLNSLEGISGQPDGHHMVVAPNDLEPAGGERASLADDLSDGEQVSLDSRQQAHLELHRLDRGARRDRTHREVTRRVRQQSDETPVDDAMPFFELGPKRQTHARQAVLAIAECHAQVAADRSRLEELFEFFEMRGTLRRFTRPLVADTFGQRNRHRLGFIAGSRTRPCSGFLASRPRKDVSLPWSFFHIETRSTMLRVTCCLRRS